MYPGVSSALDDCRNAESASAVFVEPRSLRLNQKTLKPLRTRKQRVPRPLSAKKGLKNYLYSSFGFLSISMR